jgi:TetR/AcrR family transcriptional regulator
MLTIAGYVAELIDELNCCVVLMEDQALEPEDKAKLVRERDKFERALRALVREGIADGSVAPCDPKLAIFVILGAINWVPKWFKPSGPWKPEQLAKALSEIFDRAISSSPAVAMARDVGDLPLGEPAKAARAPATVADLPERKARRARNRIAVR